MLSIWNFITRHLKPGWVAFWVLLPFGLLLVFGATVEVNAIDRFDSRYFTEEYTNRYATPGAVLTAMEDALLTGDRQTIEALQGRTSPVLFDYNPNIQLYGLYEASNGMRLGRLSDSNITEDWEQFLTEADFLTYIYFIPNSPGRVPIHLEQVDGRWVLTTLDPYVVWNSGRWLTAFVPVLVLYWMGLAVTLSAVWLYRASMVLNEELFTIKPSTTST